MKMNIRLFGKQIVVVEFTGYQRLVKALRLWMYKRAHDIMLKRKKARFRLTPYRLTAIADRLGGITPLTPYQHEQELRALASLMESTPDTLTTKKGA